jgi:hypothetical protein
MRVAVCPLVSDHGPEMSHRWFRFFFSTGTVLLWVVFLWARRARSPACRCLDLGTPTQVFIQAGSGLYLLAC